LKAATERVRDSEAFLRRVRELYANPDAEDACEIELKDGRTLERHSVGLRGGVNQYLGRVWFFRDISERRKNEARLRELARRDSLTGVSNRGHLFDRAADELLRARRYRRPLTVLMLDLDHFKLINDQHGHAAGDRVLRVACRRWIQLLRSMDLLGRIGGEEFAVLMPETDLEAGRAAADRLRAAVADRPISARGVQIHCTVSAGITVLRDDDKSVEEALRRADTALYRAKEAGRNRVETDSPRHPSV
jgi:diguanylate cyclase (GGDEF)-like protein